jgi:hypothetical protein
LPFLLYTCFFAYYDAWNASNVQRTVTLFEKSAALNIDSSYYLVGKTNQFIFLRSDVKKENLAISLLEITTIKSEQ